MAEDSKLTRGAPIKLVKKDAVIRLRIEVERKERFEAFADSGGLNVSECLHDFIGLMIDNPFKRQRAILESMNERITERKDAIEA